MVTREKMNRDQMAAIVAQHLEPGWVVNLGFGMPAWVSNYIYPEMDITLHAEHGLLGYGPVAGVEVEDPDVFNASGDYVTLLPGAVVMNQAESFAMIRAGIIDCVILGSYQVDQYGTFANWKISLDLPTGLGNVIGGAMDLAQCSKRVFVMMDHTTNSGEPRLVERCTLPPTALNVVNVIVTDLGVFAPTGSGFELRQHAPGYTLEDIQAVTAARLTAAPDLRPAL